MASDAPLSELCSICYIEKPKYRCPRCKTRTCSLPCYKKHQQRASCNGKRDPAEYLKKSQLATPASFDRDYNYLKGLEDSIDHANRETVQRGMGDAAELSLHARRNQHPDSKLHKYFRQNRITVEKVPIGMSRQKTNHTRRSKRDNVMWTVEWVDDTGQSETQDHCLESDTIESIRAHLELEKRNKELRKLPAIHTKKRKIDQVQPSEETKQPKRTEQAPKSEQQVVSESSEEEEEAASSIIKSGLNTPVAAEHRPDADCEAHIAASGFGAEEVPAHRDPPAENQRPASSHSTTSAQQIDKPSEPEPARWFYLLKIGTPSSSKVLIPLERTTTLTKALQDQVVLEYPTIFVLDQPPEQLPAGFLLEKEYLKDRVAQDKELNGALREAKVSHVRPQPPASHSSRDDTIDATKILDLLKRDVTR